MKFGSWCVLSKYLVNEWVRRSQAELLAERECKGGGRKQGSLVVSAGYSVLLGKGKGLWPLA